MGSLSVILPLYNGNPDVIDYVINDMLEKGIDEIILSNTGERKFAFQHHRVLEVWQPLPEYCAGITRNMGATVANGDVQIQFGHNLLLAEGSWDVFRGIENGQFGSIPWGRLNATQSGMAMKGARVFSSVPCKGTIAALGMTKHTAVMMFKGPFDWALGDLEWIDMSGINKAKLPHTIFPGKVIQLNP